MFNELQVIDYTQRSECKHKGTVKKCLDIFSFGAIKKKHRTISGLSIEHHHHHHHHHSFSQRLLSDVFFFHLYEKRKIFDFIHFRIDIHTNDPPRVLAQISAMARLAIRLKRQLEKAEEIQIIVEEWSSKQSLKDLSFTICSIQEVVRVL